jgi:hypothetical protein
MPNGFAYPQPIGDKGDTDPDTDNTSIFKKWWFWVGIVAGVLLLFVLGFLWYRSMKSKIPNETKTRAANQARVDYLTRNDPKPKPSPTPTPTPTPTPKQRPWRPNRPTVSKPLSGLANSV